MQSDADCTGDWMQRNSVPSHRLEQAQQERDAGLKKACGSLTAATAAERQLTNAASEAATAKAEAATAANEAATANAEAATASKQAAVATTRLRKVPCKAALPFCVLFMG